MNNEFIEKNYATLLQLQQSLNSYLESIHQLTVAIEKNTSLEDLNKLQAKKSISNTIATLIEVQKIVYKKIELLIQEWDIKDSVLLPTDLLQSFYITKINSQITHMKSYHLKKEYQYRTVVRYEGTEPAPPWRSKMLSN